MKGMKLLQYVFYSHLQAHTCSIKVLFILWLQLAALLCQIQLRPSP